jgi:Tfp pilus assembly protein PilO
MTRDANGLRARLREFDLRRDLWRIVGVLAVLAGLNLGFYLFLNLPRLRALANLQATRDAAAHNLKMALARRDEMRELIGRHDEEAKRLEEFFSVRLGTQAERMTDIQKAIREIASEFRIDPEAIDYNVQEVERSDLLRFQVTVPLVGGYPNLRQFINRIERAPRLVIIDEVQLTGAREGGAMLSLTIKVSTYFRSGRAPAQVAGAAPPAV